MALKRKRYRERQYHLIGEQQRITLRNLIANLIGNQDRLFEMRKHAITPDFIQGDDLALERDTLRFIYECKKEGIPPDKKNIFTFLSQYHENAKEWLDDLYLNYRTFDHDVLSHAAALSDWTKRQKQKSIANILVEIANDETLNPLDAYNQMIAHFQYLVPENDNFHTSDHLTAAHEWLRWQDNNVELRKAGKTIGPRLPWEATWKILPYINPGEPCLMYARSGLGKTNLAVHIAEYISYVLGDYNVLFCHFETDQKRMVSRIMSRKLKIPMWALEPGYYQDEDVNGKSDVYIELDNPKWKPLVDEELERIRLANEKKGKLYFHHCNGASLYDLDLEIQKHINNSIREGRKLVIIIDYYQKIKWQGVYPNAEGEPAGLNRIAHHFKEMCENYNRQPDFTDKFYAFMMAQDDPKAPKETEEVTIRGGKEASLVFQTAIRLWRERATTNLPLKINGMQAKNGINGDMWYHKVGEWDSLSTLQFQKSNNGATGEANIRMINEYFMVGSA